MRLGFIGTNKGMTVGQLKQWVVALRTLNPTEVHHADMIGADDQAANTIHEMYHGSTVKVFVHPGKETRLRAYNEFCHETMAMKPEDVRDRHIVDVTNVVVATPPYLTPIDETTQGGVAYSVQYARKSGKLVWIIWPNGIVSREDHRNHARS